MEEALTRGLLGFVAALRQEGVRPGRGQVQAWLEALPHLPWRWETFYQAARALLAVRREEQAAFDRAFRRYFGLGAAWPLSAPRAAGAFAVAARGEEEGEGALRGAYSPLERLRRWPLEALTPREYELLGDLLRALAFPPPRARVRRRRPGLKGERLHLPATLRRALRLGEWVELRFRAPLRRPYRFYFLLDVSGSMAPYARGLFLLLQALWARGFPLEAYAFGTRLTRITPLLGLEPRGALPELGRLAEDFAGGTRLGAALQGLAEREGRRLGRRCLLFVLSDGLDQGEPKEVARALRVLRRRVRRIFWLNPLAGLPGYAPEARGMRAALPFLDALWPLGTLEEIRAFLRRLKALGPGG
ncbi:VWA domain-containing protein [Thermus thermamylovorans]|uniref:VWA domain-containing protein n=1 Tax=Thermus thermamylovorans TaxID=2509362 RepID=UPI0011AE9A3D|nr:VWA domain-containing protein [Thermus thermamylovorans]